MADATCLLPGAKGSVKLIRYGGRRSMRAGWPASKKKRTERIWATLLAVAALCWIWLPEREGQDRAVLSYTLAFPTLLLLAIWLLFFARLARRRRTFRRCTKTPPDGTQP